MDYIFESKITSITLTDSSKCMKNLSEEPAQKDCLKKAKLNKNDLKSIFTELSTKTLYQKELCGKGEPTYNLSIKYSDKNNNKYCLDIDESGIISNSNVNNYNTFDEQFNNLINNVQYTQLDEYYGNCSLFTFENENDSKTINIMENIFNKYLK